MPYLTAPTCPGCPTCDPVEAARDRLGEAHYALDQVTADLHEAEARVSRLRWAQTNARLEVEGAEMALGRARYEAGAPSASI